MSSNNDSNSSQNYKIITLYTYIKTYVYNSASYVYLYLSIHFKSYNKLSFHFKRLKVNTSFLQLISLFNFGLLINNNNNSSKIQNHTRYTIGIQILNIMNLMNPFSNIYIYVCVCLFYFFLPRTIPCNLHL